MNFAIEWKPQDLWVGVFWKRSRNGFRLDVWVCIIPCLPLHFWNFPYPQYEP